MLQNKRVVILGGSSGLGLATAKAAAAEGASIVIVSSDQTRINEALKQLPGQSEGYVTDLSDEGNIRGLFGRIGKFDHLVYTAGENLSLTPIDELNLAQARSFFTIRFWGAMAAVKYGHAQLNPGGSISLTSGTAGERPRKGWSVAASICTAMEGFTRAMAVELAPIRVNVVIPGVIHTNLWNGIPDAARQAFFDSEASRLPAGRIGEAEDIAKTFVYFMNMPYITGQAVVVDGGSVLV
jgi:NAD(P)-dependent dehydrogenase (short-subunit alcohol dehydrogenase family)